MKHLSYLEITRRVTDGQQAAPPDTAGLDFTKPAPEAPLFPYPRALSREVIEDIHRKYFPDRPRPWDKKRSAEEPCPEQ